MQQREPLIRLSECSIFEHGEKSGELFKIARTYVYTIINNKKRKECA